MHSLPVAEGATLGSRGGSPWGRRFVMALSIIGVCHETNGVEVVGTKLKKLEEPPFGVFV
jgi:hypothetical protein